MKPSELGPDKGYDLVSVAVHPDGRRASIHMHRYYDGQVHTFQLNQQGLWVEQFISGPNEEKESDPCIWLPSMQIAPFISTIADPIVGTGLSPEEARAEYRARVKRVFERLQRGEKASIDRQAAHGVPANQGF